MKFKECQSIVRKFVDENKINCPPESRLIDLYSELGEVSKEILKSTNYGKKDMVVTKELEDEFGDVVFSLIALANQSNINLEKVLENSLKKYKIRLESKNDMGSGR